MISQKNLRILFILKYILFFLKTEIKNAELNLSMISASSPEAEAQKTRLRERISDFEARLVLFNKLEQADMTREEFALVLNQLIHAYEGNIRDHLSSRFGVNFTNNEENFDFSFRRDVPDEVVEFLKKPIPDETFISYQKLETKNKLPQFFSNLNFNQFKWNFWYWPKLCYGQKNQLSAWIYRFGSILSMLTLLLALPISISLLPMSIWAYSLYGFLGLMFGGMAAYSNRENIMMGIAAFLIVAGIFAAMFFCPPLSLTLLFGLQLTGAMAMLNFVPVAIISMVAMIIQKVAEPSNEIKQQALFAPSSFSKPEPQKVRHEKKEKELREIIHQQQSLSKLFQPEKTKVLDPPNSSTPSCDENPKVKIHGHSQSH